jgi:putative DNA primase/helicase
MEPVPDLGSKANGRVGRGAGSERERIRDALYFIPATDRDTWVRMAMAVKAKLGEEGFDLWDSWSQQADSYNAKDAQDVWRSLKANGGVTAGTLFHEAKAHGWRHDGTYQKPIPEEAEARRRLAAERAAKEEAEKVRERAEAASKARALWKAATSVREAHPFLVRKGVSPVPSLREIDAGAAAALLGYAPKCQDKPLGGGLLVVPIKVASELSSVEFIDEAGRKSALYGGAKTGGYWAAQPLPNGDGTGLTLLVGEGVATVLSAREATGHLVIAALSSGNLLAVAREMRERYPKAVLVVLSDLIKATGEPNPYAIEAARAISGLVAVPDFGEDRPEGATDFNDLAVLRGLEAVAACIRRQAFPNDSARGVTSVTGVQARCNAGSSRYTTEKSGVIGVTEPGEGHATPEAEDGDHVAEGIPQLSERPCFRVFDEGVEHQTGKLRPGVWFFGVKRGQKAEDPPTLTQQWVCSPIHIKAVTEDGQDNNFGRLLSFRNTLGRWREWSIPMDLLRGPGDEMRGELLAMGVEIDPLSKALLSQYLQHVHPKRQVRCAQQVGWCGDSFVLPDTAIGPGASDVIFQCRDHEHIAYTQAGTLAEWRSAVAARAPGNPPLVLALSASFAGPMLRRCNAEGGGMHFTGDSSIGKTAAIDAACSTWGGDRFRRSWKTTSIGLEGAAALCNDGLLALDEINECDPREVGAIVYALANGYGKQRASRTGSARPVTRWRCFVLSSGERTIATHMAEGGRRAKAGQSVRLLDVPVSGKFGAWNNLHGFPTGATFSDELKRAAVSHYGHAGRAFLEKLTRDTHNFCAWLERIKALPEFSVEGGEGQDKRAAARFALVALAGEVATEYEITSWEAGTAIEAAAEGFQAWRSLRGRGNDERWKILEAVSDFIDRHGDSRFSEDTDAEAMRVNRSGWWRDDGKDGRVYLFNTDGLREALTGFDFRRALDTLQEAGVLPPPDASGKRSTPQRIGGRLVRLYTIRVDKLEADHGA